MVVLAKSDADSVRLELAAFVRLHEPSTVVAERLRLDQDHVWHWLLRLELKRHAIRSPRFEISAGRTRRSVLLQHTPEILPVRVVLERRCEPLELRSIYVSHADRKSTRLNSSHSQISYAVFCLKKKST